MRRLKAIYLYPVFVVLFIGAGCAAYFLLLSPQMDKTNKAKAAWVTARDTANGKEGDYQKALDDKVTYAKQFYEAYHRFHKLQEQMPHIYNMSEMYKGREREGLREWYRIMGTGQLISELTAWSRQFHLSNPPRFKFQGTLGFEDTLPSAKLVEIDFDKQMLIGRGLPDLLAKLETRTGYSYFPLIITFVGGADNKAGAQGGAGSPGTPSAALPTGERQASIRHSNNTTRIATAGLLGSGQLFAQGGQPMEEPSGAGMLQQSTTSTTTTTSTSTAASSGGVGTIKIVVDRSNRRHRPEKPVLILYYTAKGYFFTRGWDPTPGADVDIKAAETIILNPPQKDAKRFAPPTPCPALFWIIKPQGLEPY